MSAPDTNVEGQVRRHRPALIGIAAAVLAVVAGFTFYLGYLAASGQTPEDAEVQIDGRTGAVIETQ